jgi:hypothetical protein
MTTLRDLAEVMMCEKCESKGYFRYSSKWDVVFCTCLKGWYLFITRVTIGRRIGWIKVPVNY